MYGYGSCYYLPRIDLKNEELLWSKNIIIGQATRPPDKGMVWRLAGSYSWSIDLLSSNQLATPSSAFCSKLIENPETPIYTMLTDATLVKRLTTGPVVKKS